MPKSRLKRVAKGQPVAAKAPPVQTFRGRRTLADHVNDNMLCAGKVSYHQRVIFVASHAAHIDVAQLKFAVETLAKDINRTAAESDEMTGLIVIYSTHSMCMLEGSEKCIGLFTQQLTATICDSFYKQNRVVLVYNNANQRYFEKMLFAEAEPKVLIIKNAGRDFESLQYHNHMVIKRVMAVCEKISIGCAEHSFDPNRLGEDVVKILPEVALIEYVLNIEQLLTLHEFGQLFDCIPQFQYSDELVWPIPFDFTPDNVYDWGRYDVNLIFGRQKMAEASAAAK